LSVQGAVAGGPAAAGIGERLRHEATWRVTAIAVGAGILTDMAIRSGVANVTAAVLAAGTACALASDERLSSRQARGLALGAVAFAPWLAVWQSPWLVIPNVLAAFGLLCLAASFAAGGSVLDLGLGATAARAGSTAAHGLAGISYPVRPVIETEARPAVAGVALAVPVVLVLGLLLASADAVFRSFFKVDADAVVEHFVLFSLGAWAAGGLWRTAAARPPEVRVGRVRRLGLVESRIVLTAVNLLFLGFVAAQVVAASEGGRRVLRTEGLTYAEYARSGFFQLVAVAALSMVLVAALRAVVRKSSDITFRAMSALTVALTLGLCTVAYVRLGLYETAFGLTMLRFYAQASTIWIGIVLVLVVLAVFGVGRAKRWLIPTAAAAALAILLALNVLGPEAHVAGRNLDRGTHALDVPYLASLGDDALPAIAARIDGLGAEQRSELRAGVECSRRRSPSSRAGWNLSRERVRDALRTICGKEGA
jgi:hypothetical protein